MPREVKAEVLSCESEDIETTIHSASETVIAVCENCTININTRTATTYSSETSKLRDYCFKHKLLDTVNVKIEQSIEKYIIYNNSLIHYHPSFIKLQRLNI